LTHRNGLLEAEVEKLETGIKEAKSIAGEASNHSSANENLTRKLQLLEEEAEAADKSLRETNEKYAPFSLRLRCC
jgi:tropomyosin, fungi type